MSVRVSRNGQTTVMLQPNFSFNGNPQTYNFSQYWSVRASRELMCRLLDPVIVKRGRWTWGFDFLLDFLLNVDTWEE